MFVTIFMTQLVQTVKVRVRGLYENSHICTNMNKLEYFLYLHINKTEEKVQTLRPPITPNPNLTLCHNSATIHTKQYPRLELACHKSWYAITTYPDALLFPWIRGHFFPPT